MKPKKRTVDVKQGSILSIVATVNEVSKRFFSLSKNETHSLIDSCQNRQNSAPDEDDLGIDLGVYQAAVDRVVTRACDRLVLAGDEVGATTTERLFGTGQAVRAAAAVLEAEFNATIGFNTEPAIQKRCDTPPLPRGVCLGV